MTITTILDNILTCSFVPSLDFVIAALLALRVCTLKMQIHLNVQISPVIYELQTTDLNFFRNRLYLFA